MRMSRPESLRVLGLAHGASSESVREAYLRLAKQHHPDLATSCPREATETFKRISVAYETVRTPGGGMERTVGDRYEDLMARRAREPWIIRWLWRGPSVGTKFAIKLSVMAALVVAAVIDDRARDDRGRRRKIGTATT